MIALPHLWHSFLGYLQCYLCAFLVWKHNNPSVQSHQWHRLDMICCFTAMTQRSQEMLMCGNLLPAVQTMNRTTLTAFLFFHLSEKLSNENTLGDICNTKHDEIPLLKVYAFILTFSLKNYKSLFCGPEDYSRVTFQYENMYMLEGKK